MERRVAREHGHSRRRAMSAGDIDYETHGSGYAQRRRADPRIAAFIRSGLGQAHRVLNVGAGAGSYEPDDRYVVAVEPSAAMRAQRPLDRVPAIDAVAEELPFDDNTFDAAMATLTIHQWKNLDAGLRELRRISRDVVVILTFDSAALQDFWLQEYLSEVIAIEQRRFPPIEHVNATLGGHAEVVPVPIPRDCVDGFGEAYYARPEAFLEPAVRAAQSGWALADPVAVQRGVDQLAADLSSGTWDARHGHLREQPARMGAVRLIVARPLPGYSDGPLPHESAPGGARSDRCSGR